MIYWRGVEIDLGPDVELALERISEGEDLDLEAVIDKVTACGLEALYGIRASGDEIVRRIRQIATQEQCGRTCLSSP